MSLTFEWDTDKADANRRKHGVTFHEAATTFGDPASITIADPDHLEAEERFVQLGRSYLGRLLVVVHVERGNNMRIISARSATKAEQRVYEDG